MTDFNDDFDPDVAADCADVERKAAREDVPPVKEREVTVCQDAEGAWRVRLTDAPEGQYLAFGPAIYGGSLEQAEEDAARVASKWGWGFLPHGVTRDGDAVLVERVEPGPGAGARMAEMLRIASWAVGAKPGERLRITTVRESA